MFSYNKSNYPAKNKLTKLDLLQNPDPPKPKCISVLISDSYEATAFFGIIQQLILTNNFKYLRGIQTQCQNVYTQLQQQSREDTSPYEKFLAVISELIKGMQEQHQNTTLLRELYNKRQSIMPYLKILIDGFQPACLEMLSKQFKIVISLYTLDRQDQENLRIVLVREINKGEQYQKLFEVRVISIEQGFYLMYPYNHAQMDSISKLYFNYEKQISMNIDLQEKIKFNQYQNAKRIKELETRFQQQLSQNTKRIKQLQSKNIQQISQIKILQNQTKNIQEQYNELNEKLATEYETSKKLKNENRQKYQQIQQLKEQNQELERKLRTKDTQKPKPKFLEPQPQKSQDPFPTFFPRKQGNYTELKPKNNVIQMEFFEPKESKVKIIKEEQIPKASTSSYSVQKEQQFIGYPRQKMLTNFLDIEWRDSTVQQKQCKTCLEEMIPYILFKCSHISCATCLTNAIDASLKQGKLPICLTENCGGECDEETVIEFLKSRGDKKLEDKFSDFQFKKHYGDKLFACPECLHEFQIDPKNNFFTHCGKTFCRKCGAPHKEDQKCDEARLLTALEILDCPSICPVCKQLFEKIEGCEDIKCRNCKDAHPEGFCERCSVLRSPIKSHDNSYHRPDCIRNQPHNQAIKRNNNCTECKNTPGEVACKKPETLKEFLEKNFSKEFAVKYFEKRAAYDAKGK